MGLTSKRKFCEAPECFETAYTEMRMQVERRLWWKMQLCWEHVLVFETHKLDIQVAVLDAMREATRDPEPIDWVSPRPS